MVSMGILKTLYSKVTGKRRYRKGEIDPIA